MWTCVCGNCNTIKGKCIKCGRPEYQDMIFKWDVSIKRRFNNAIEKTEYIVDVFKFNIHRERNLTKISIMILPITFGKSSHRAVTIDIIEIEKYILDVEIRDIINSWIDNFRKRIENIQVN